MAFKNMTQITKIQFLGEPLIQNQLVLPNLNKIVGRFQTNTDITSEHLLNHIDCTIQFLEGDEFLLSNLITARIKLQKPKFIIVEAKLKICSEDELQTSLKRSGDKLGYFKVFKAKFPDVYVEQRILQMRVLKKKLEQIC